MNRKLAAVSTFYEFHARSGVAVADLLVTMRPAGPHRSAATSYKPFLQHIASGMPGRTRTIKRSKGWCRSRMGQPPAAGRHHPVECMPGIVGVYRGIGARHRCTQWLASR
ncbi:hypothetical protein ACIGXF_38050 [Streptomyces sp. NPDC053086]|uniref:hypothetical protein n=1 Tax=unclassified Streptomyces TaxID=2593676 RepID=UPI0037D93B17